MASTATKTVASLGIVLPICTGIYTQQQERIESRRQEAVARQEQAAASAASKRDQDRSTAMVLIEKLTGGAGDSEAFCAYFFEAAYLVAAQDGGAEHSSLALEATLRYRRERGTRTVPAGRHLVCDCPNSLRQLHAFLAAPGSAGADRAAGADAQAPGDAPGHEVPLTPLAEAVTQAYEACLPELRAAEEAEKKPRSSADRGPASAEPPPVNCQLAGPQGAVTVYIHIPDESERPRAQALRELLQRSGYLAPGIENVGCAKSPATQVAIKRFHSRDRERFEQLTDSLERCMAEPQSGLDLPALNKIKLSGYANVPVRLFEIWFPRSGACLQPETD